MTTSCLPINRLCLLALLLISITRTSADADTTTRVPTNRLTAEELRAGWILLFDGESLFGWKRASKADWTVADGAIQVSKGEPGLLHTTTQFADYELKLDFRAAAETNSGLFLRTSPRPKTPTSGCYELNIASAESNPFPTGSFVGRKRIVEDNGFKRDAAGSSTESVQGLEAGWHRYHVTVRGGMFTIVLDGREVLTYEDPKPLGRGFIGLQRNKGAVAFRNIKLRPLGLHSCFNGKDLTGWRIYPDKPSKFSVTPEGTLHVEDGPGQLETTELYADVVLQTEVLVNGKELNSGIFFRSIPGDYQNGYESQIHNGVEPGEGAKPSLCGTGGIFRRQPARQVLAKDFAWFTKTIVCEGPHMAVWVEGVQVSDWTDRRPPHANPRKGRRLEKGTIILQGHDPTTDLFFRNMRIGEIPPRR